MLGEASIGLTKRFGISLDASLAPNYQTKEIKYGIDSRDIRWSGLAITAIVIVLGQDAFDSLDDPVPDSVPEELIKAALAHQKE